LGIGNSSHGDPFNEIQAQAEVEALNEVTTQIRNGQIHEIGTYNKVIHVGHSFGSVQSYGLSALYPNNTDGLVLTGYSTAGQFLSYIVAGWNLHSARLNQPFRLGNASSDGLRQLAAKYGVSGDLEPKIYTALQAAGVGISSQDVKDIAITTEVLDLTTGSNESVYQYDYPSGYMAPSDLTALQYAFLYPGNYDLALAIAGEQTKQPVTTGEILTIGNAPKMSPFTGPVLVVTGEHDVPFCT
jgi:pimeloyl-ACP methyl ester carboxylesterase